MAAEKICTICRKVNVDTASVCSYCGAELDENATKTNIVAITEYAGVQPNITAEDVAAFIDVSLIPEGGIGIHIAGAPNPYYIPISRELVIGRQTGAALESILDLTDQDAFNMGVSRRHALIRRMEFGFEVIDLVSRNGTWLNAEQLVPNKPYPFASGSQLRIGAMRLIIVYNVVGKGFYKK